MFDNKRVTIAISGGIAAYKAAEIVSWLNQNGATVQVVMTKAAEEFITPLTLKSLSGRTVARSAFAGNKGELAHLDIAACDLFAVVPATANIIAKAAHGVCDDLVSTALLATEAPVLFAPAMHCRMYANPLTQNNIRILKDRGCYFIEPGYGRLACGAEGQGRLAELNEIKAAIAQFLLAAKTLSGLHVLVTAGPTREKIDPVRYLSNFSSGKMGYALAAAAYAGGAKVTLVSGPTCLTPPVGVELISVQSAREMYDAVHRLYDSADIVIKAAAVADYRPRDPACQKLKKGDRLSLELVANPDILRSLGEKKGRRILVGFAAETENLCGYAGQKLKAKNLDMIVANDVSLPDSGFGGDFNTVTIITESGCLELPKMSKLEAAVKILEAISQLPRFLEIKQCKNKGE